VAPEELAKPIKRMPERAFQLYPSTFLNVKVDGVDTSYFEWLGAGVYSPERRGGSMHGRVFFLRELRYGFEEDRFVLRVDCFPESLSELEDPEFRIILGAREEITIVVNLERGRVKEFAVEKSRVCLLNPETLAAVAFRRTLELAVMRECLDLDGLAKFTVGVALWHGGLPVDVLPSEGFFDVHLGEEHSAWAVVKTKE
jgi:hypothetical protein